MKIRVKKKTQSLIIVKESAPQRFSRRLAIKAELAGGRKVYSHTQAPHVPSRWHN
jgi:hypothetical protein